MIWLWKKFTRRRAVPVPPRPSMQDLDTRSPADLRKVIDELEAAIAEHEATNSFLRDLLTERWFEAEANHLDDAHALARL